MTRLLILSGYYPPNVVGGGDISTRILAEACSEAGADVKVLTCADKASNSVINGVSIGYVKSPNLYWRIGSSRSIPQRLAWHALESFNPRSIAVVSEEIKAFRPDVLVTSTLENFGVSAWAAATRLQIPIVHILRSFYLQCWRGSRFKNNHICQTRCFDCSLVTAARKKASHEVAAVVGISDYILEAHLSEGYFQNAKAFRIFNPIEEIMSAHRATRRAAPITTFGYLGALQPSKGIEQLVHAVGTKTEGSKLLIAGRGETSFVKRLQAAANPKNTEFLGWLDPVNLFERIDFLIFPSIWNEPFGRGIVEAMGHAIPVIGSKRGGIPELIQDGSNGILFEPDSLENLGQSIDKAIKSDLQPYSRAALGSAARFAKPIIANEFLAAIESLSRNATSPSANLSGRSCSETSEHDSPPIADHRLQRLLIISGNYPPHTVGGGEIATQLLAQGFAEAGLEVRVLTCGEIEEQRMDGRVTVSSIRSPNIYWRYLSTLPDGIENGAVKKAIWHILDNYNPCSMNKVKRAVLSFKPDLVLTSVLENFGASAWLSAHRAGVPVIDIVHSYYLQCIFGSRFRRGKNCERVCTDCHLANLGKKTMSQYVDGVVGVSRHILLEHTRDGYFPNALKTYVYNPVEGDEAEPRISLRASSPTFGYLGKLLPTKGIEELVIAFSQGDIPGKLIVAGDGHSAFDLRIRQLADPRFVQFLGWTRPRHLFDQIDFLIFPSLWHEPFGRGVVEAMHNAIPVIGANRGGIREIIAHGKDGFIYEPTDPNSLKIVVTQALEADYRSLSYQATITSRRFAKTAIIGQLIKFMKLTIAGGPRLLDDPAVNSEDQPLSLQ